MGGKVRVPFGGKQRKPSGGGFQLPGYRCGGVRPGGPAGLPRRQAAGRPSPFPDAQAIGPSRGGLGQATGVDLRAVNVVVGPLFPAIDKG